MNVPVLWGLGHGCDEYCLSAVIKSLSAQYIFSKTNLRLKEIIKNEERKLSGIYLESLSREDEFQKSKYCLWGEKDRCGCRGGW